MIERVKSGACSSRASGTTGTGLTWRSRFGNLRLGGFRLGGTGRRIPIGIPASTAQLKGAHGHKFFYRRAALGAAS